MKICILSMQNIKHMSLITHYTKILKKANLDYDIIYIDKYGEEEHIEAKNKYKYNLKIKRNDSFIKKLIKYYGFNKFAKRKLREHNYDLIIIWGTGTALLLFEYFLFEYKNKFVLNVRDYVFEENKIVYKITKKIIEKSFLNTVSSEGFLQFLPKNDYLMLHSYNETLLENLKPKTDIQPLESPIRITFIGNVRFFDKDKKILDVFGNDSRFIIQYFGTGANILKEYSNKKKYKNVIFHDSFNVEKTNHFLEKADVINNLYGKNNIALDTAISIKYYYALHMKIPILVFTDTYMETVSKNTGIAYPVETIDQNFKNSFYNWYRSIDFDLFSYNCEKEIQKIKKTNKEFEVEFKKILDTV